MRRRSRKIYVFVSALQDWTAAAWSGYARGLLLRRVRSDAVLFALGNGTQFGRTEYAVPQMEAIGGGIACYQHLSRIAPSRALKLLQ